MKTLHCTQSLFIVVSMVFAGLLLPQASFAVGDCNIEYVNTGATVVTVAPSAMDDTGNIQCALDTAVDMSIPVVQLKSGDFTISSLTVTGFNGVFSGYTRKLTSITTLENGLDCAGQISSGRAPAVIKFIGGSPTLRNMNITFARPCDRTNLVWAIHFTGRSVVDECGTDVVFGEISRVDLVGLNPDLIVYMNGIAATAEGHWFSVSCSRNLTGTFKVNRSSISNFHSPVITSMQSFSPVDIRFNDFMNFDYAVWIRDSNQDTSISGNNFVLGAFLNANPVGVLIDTIKDTAPASTTVKINKNTFTNLDNAEAIIDRNASGVAQVTFWVSNNTFDWRAGTPGTGYAIRATDINRGVVSSNVFQGAFDHVIFLGNPTQADSITGWSITGNYFDNVISGFNQVTFNSEVKNSVFGPGQPGKVMLNDNGTDNHNLN